jgi:hypothetical protein
MFTAWADHVSDVGQLTGHLATVFGWTLRTEVIMRPTTLQNYPMQANGAEMLRLACCFATDRTSGVFPTDDSLHQLEIRIQAIQLSRGSRSASLHTPEHDRCFPSMLLSPSPFRIQVSHQTQECSSKFLLTESGI